jgi:hypothetical protein
MEFRSQAWPLVSCRASADQPCDDDAMSKGAKYMAHPAHMRLVLTPPAQCALPAEPGAPVLRPQVGNPAEEDLKHFGWHSDASTVLDDVMQAVAGAEVSFVFSCQVDGKSVEPAVLRVPEKMAGQVAEWRQQQEAAHRDALQVLAQQAVPVRQQQRQQKAAQQQEEEEEEDDWDEQEEEEEQGVQQRVASASGGAVTAEAAAPALPAAAAAAAPPAPPPPPPPPPLPAAAAAAAAPAASKEQHSRQPFLALPGNSSTPAAPPGPEPDSAAARPAQAPGAASGITRAPHQPAAPAAGTKPSGSGLSRLSMSAAKRQRLEPGGRSSAAAAVPAATAAATAPAGAQAVPAGKPQAGPVMVISDSEDDDFMSQ